nr:GH3 auxin-responsive promoter family protein [Propionibacterium sp.]
MRLTTAAANAAIATACAPAHARLLALAGGDGLRRAQARLLGRMLARNAGSEFGRRHAFGRLRGVSDYARAVPLSTWDDYADAVARIAAGTPGVLTAEPVRLLEPSSGSTAATKLVPYPAGLRADFGRGLRPWLHDLDRSFPGVRTGRAYWSVTPAVSRPAAAGGVRVGFDEDADYFGPLTKHLMGAVFAVGGDVARVATMDEFRARTLTALLAADDLALVSVWNPTFFTLLLDWAADHATGLTAGLPARRRSVLAGAVRAGDWAAVWPRLTVVSCWADAQAAPAASELAGRLPQALLQPKGLLATECIVSVPIERAGGAVLAARSHFFEFVGEGGGDPVLAHELEAGRRYAVVVTTSGGLYRYRLGDLVEVTGHFGALPVLRFVGRADRVSDLVGEKLAEAFVASALAAAGASGFAVLTPDGRRGYVLVTDAPSPGLAERLDAALRQNFHYDYARRLGQLDAVRVADAGPDAAERYLDACVRRGQRLGDVKVPALALGREAGSLVGGG